VHLEEAREAVGADALYATTGHWSAPHFGLPKLLWYVRERRELWKRTRWVLQFCDWLLERLCGVVASEHSSASMSQLLDVSSREWATAVLDATGIDADRLPPLRAAGSLAGGLRPDVARRVGLLPGTPVHVGGGDTHLASHGAGALERDSVTVVAGTTTPIMLATVRPLLDPHVRPLVSVHVVPGRWAAETNVGTSGAMLRWLRDLSARDYDALDALASASPLGARGAFVCAANPEWGPAEWADVPPISLVGVGPAHGVGELARAVLESSAHAVACNLSRLESLVDEPRAEIALTGGGGRSPFAAQVLADVLGRRVVVPELESAAAIGGAMLVAGLERAPVATPTAIYEPDAELHGAYAPLTRRYAEVFAGLRGTAAGSAA
jgi:sugar (pentulose or hexulose) kinase